MPKLQSPRSVQIRVTQICESQICRGPIMASQIYLNSSVHRWAFSAGVWYRSKVKPINREAMSHPSSTLYCRIKVTLARCSAVHPIITVHNYVRKYMMTQSVLRDQCARRAQFESSTVHQPANTTTTDRRLVQHFSLR